MPSRYRVDRKRYAEFSLPYEQRFATELSNCSRSRWPQRTGWGKLKKNSAYLFPIHPVPWTIRAPLRTNGLADLSAAARGSDFKGE